VVCTGNVCRSPIAEALLRRALNERLGAAAPEVVSAGTEGWDGAAATFEAVEAGAERGVDLEGHTARRLTAALVQDATLVLAMAREHRDEVIGSVPSAHQVTFTLKELTRLLEAAPVEGEDPQLADRLAAAARLREEGFAGNPLDEDVVDPIGMPLDTYRAVAWELETWIGRLADGLVGPVKASLAGEDR
jgi:protein-tyrosine phosphatase